MVDRFVPSEQLYKYGSCANLTVFFFHIGQDLLLVSWRTADEDVKDVDSAAHHLQVRISRRFKRHCIRDER